MSVEVRPVMTSSEMATPLGGATPLWEWIGDDATVFSY